MHSAISVIQAASQQFGTKQAAATSSQKSLTIARFDKREQRVSHHGHTILRYQVLALGTHDGWAQCRTSVSSEYLGFCLKHVLVGCWTSPPTSLISGCHPCPSKDNSNQSGTKVLSSLCPAVLTPVIKKCFGRHQGEHLPDSGQMPDQTNSRSSDDVISVVPHTFLTPYGPSHSRMSECSVLVSVQYSISLFSRS